MGELGAAQFPSFLREVTGHDPFPWQERLLAEVLSSGWPQLLDLPTGVGKTSVLLVALFALAANPERSHRRIALVVDRRMIVDQVDNFARSIRAALADPERPTCSEVAARLRALSSAGSEAVRVVHLRGGVPRDDTWIGSPDQPTILASTVDQVGSRILFRGYGVSEGMRPVHAGVLARDTLYFLDEVHLATAFQETLDRLQGTYSRWAEVPVGRPFQVVSMSATPDQRPRSSVFRLADEDRRHPVLARRLAAGRRAELEVVATSKTSDSASRARNRQEISNAVCKRAKQAARLGSRTIGVVVNRVDTARRAASALREADQGEVILITGRMRPFDRAAVQAALERTAMVGALRPADDPPAFVVATSCIEAGADLDFDALVTEAASLDSLRQRFGRLNRIGTYEDARAWILAAKDQVSDSAEDDPVYGAALRNTWRYLEQHADKSGVVDFGLDSFPVPSPEELVDLLPASPEAPVLFPSYLDMWSETRPAPHPDPDPSLWLHGKGQRPAHDVGLVFRADLGTDTADADTTLERVSDALEFLPPVTDEVVSVPIYELKLWLDEGKAAWCWKAGGVEPLVAADIRPGMTVVVDAGLGGLRGATWDPAATQACVDVAELATFCTRGHATLRVDPRTLPVELAPSAPRPPRGDDPEAFEAAREECLAWVRGLAAQNHELPGEWGALLEVFADRKATPHLRSIELADGSRIWRIVARKPERALEATTEDSVSPFSGLETTLEVHLHDVEHWAAQFASRAGLDPALAGDLALAGLLHDLGKADLRFQALLQGGDPITAAVSEPLAKSGQAGSAASRERARLRSRWPLGLRHELISLALLDASPELRERAADLELVRHLVASHHGWCRPWAPAMLDPDPQTVTATVAGIGARVNTAALDAPFLAECSSRFRRLCRRYGWHGLAYLEALLRLADHRASASPGARHEGLD